MTIEGIAAMAVFFMALLVIVQVGFLMTSRSIVAASVDAAARRASYMGADVSGEAERLRTEVTTAVPGAEVDAVEIDRSASQAHVALEYRWRPPGPDLLPLTIRVERSRALAVPP